MPALPLRKEPSLLFFGRLSWYKGVDVLLDAMQLLWRRTPEARVVIATGGELPEHQVLADPHILVRHPHVPEADVPALFGDARCVVLPYREASQSGVGARAKGFGRPLVVSDVGDLPDSRRTGAVASCARPIRGRPLRPARGPHGAVRRRKPRPGSSGFGRGVQLGRVGELTLDAS